MSNYLPRDAMFIQARYWGIDFLSVCLSTRPSANACTLTTKEPVVSLSIPKSFIIIVVIYGTNQIHNSIKQYNMTRKRNKPKANDTMACFTATVKCVFYLHYGK